MSNKGQKTIEEIAAASKQKTRAGLVHLGTKVITAFGLRDSDGNVERQEPLRSDLPILTAQKWEEHRENALKVRKELDGANPDKTVVHIATAAEVTFGVEDEDGNIINQIPQTVQFVKFTQNNFSECFEKIVEQRKKLRDGLLARGE